jgi:exosortase
MLPAISIPAPEVRTRWPHWLPSLWVAILLAVTFGPTLTGIYGSWFDEHADMGHGLAVPLVAGWMIWNKRDALARLPQVPNYFGLFLVLLGALQFTVGSAADWVFATRSSFLVSLIGCVLSLWGVRVLRALAYPLGLLLLMITPPTFLQERLTFQLQLIASRLAEWSLDALGYSVLRDGNILEMVGERMSVAEACSGIRSLYALFFFCLTYNYFFVTAGRIRWVLTAGVIPLALAGNAIRIVATGVVAQYDRPLAHGFLHEAWGYITVFLAGSLIVMLHLSLNRLMVRGRKAHAL